MLTLWDLLRPNRKKAPYAPRVAQPTRKTPGTRKAPANPNSTPMQDRYDALVRDMLREHGVRVRKWRKAMTGVAWQITYADGGIARLIEAPRPKGPMSAAIFLHEIGHHAIGFHRYRPRCLEEYHAWAWSIQAMESHGITVTDSVRLRMHESLHYAIEKASRRGLQQLPAELAPFMARPPKRGSRILTRA